MSRELLEGHSSGHEALLMLTPLRVVEDAPNLGKVHKICIASPCEVMIGGKIRQTSDVYRNAYNLLGVNENV